LKVDEEALEDLELERATVLFGRKRGKYPQGNSLVVRGDRETVIIDPSLGVVDRRDRLPKVSRVLNSHCHEDHVAGNHLFPDVPWHLHESDVMGLRSLDDFMAIYGFDDHAVADGFRKVLVEQFHVVPRPDAVPFADGDVFELGGASIHVIHTPGHTRGHCVFHVQPADLLYLGDIDLSSFGPYYGDAWSDLEDFERSLERVRRVEARHYLTFHHIGLVNRDTFLQRLERFRAVIDHREERLLAFLAEPRTLEEVGRHRFVYRPKDRVAFAEPVERRSMAQHIERLVRAGRVRRIPPGAFQATAPGTFQGDVVA
jgi:glyoxylase-like metal-dependent hydrolase (beta-lactamase superfamily II)